MLTAQNAALNEFLFSTPILYPAAFIFGIIFGSFFNVIVYRAGQDDETWTKGASHCENCNHSLAWYDNIPLLSYLLLKGKCRYCGSKISVIHPLVELATGLVFVFSAYLALNFFLLPASPLLSYRFLSLILSIVVNSILWLILLIDLKYMLIPDQLVAALLFLALFWQYVNFSMGRTAVLHSLISSISFLMFFLILWLITKRKGMGLGDIKLIAPLTFLVGYPRSIVGVFFAFIIGGIWGIILLLVGRKKWGQVLPFGPFLIVGAWIALAWGQSIWQAYWQLI